MDAKLEEFWGAVGTNISAQEEFVRSGNQTLNWIAKALRESNSTKLNCYKCEAENTRQCNSCMVWACGNHATASQCVKCVKTNNTTDLSAEIKCTDMHQIISTCIKLMAIRSRTADLTDETAARAITAFTMAKRWHDIC